MSHRIHANVAAVVEFLAARGASTVNAVSEEVELPAATVRRIADGLVAAELAELDRDGRVSLTTRWLHLSESFRRWGHGWPVAHEVLRDLTVRTGLTSYFVVPDGPQVLCVDWAPGRGTGVPELRPGGVQPLHAGAGGRIALALGDVDLDTHLRQAPFEAFTAATLVSADDLRADVVRTRTSGHVVAEDDEAIGMTGLGVPIVREGRFLGALTVGGPTVDVTARREEFLEDLCAAASTLDG